MFINKTGKRLLLFIAIIIPLNAVLACDICGCFMGIVPYDNQSSISFLHRYRSFSGYAQVGQSHSIFPTNSYLASSAPTAINNNKNARITHGGHTETPTTKTSVTPSYSSKDYEVYKTYELRAKLYIHKRIELNGIVGINDNTSLESGATQHVSGISDVTTYIGYHLMQPIDFSDLQQRLIVGGGIKLPVGNYYAPNELTRAPLLMQPGTGSTDYFGFVNYLIAYKRFGVSLNSMYKLNGQNYYKERISNSTSNYLNLFFKIRTNQVTLIPSIQSYYEYTKGLYVNNVLLPETQMNVLLTGPGLDIQYKNVGLNMAFQFKAWEQTASTNLSSTGRIVLGLSYSFNQRNYLIKSTKSEQ